MTCFSLSFLSEKISHFLYFLSNKMAISPAIFRYTLRLENELLFPMSCVAEIVFFSFLRHIAGIRLSPAYMVGCVMSSHCSDSAQNFLWLSRGMENLNTIIILRVVLNY